jgi:hypothetical protein
MDNINYLRCSFVAFLHNNSLQHGKVRPLISFCGAVKIAEQFHLIMQHAKRVAIIKNFQ